jgi:U3 small nucleolar ribonucleoprotein protein IMP4
VANILKYLFPVPKPDSTRCMTFSNQSDFISFRHHVYKKTGNQVELVEVGPRFEMRSNLSFLILVYEIKLATVEMEDADVEWVWRPYQNTSRKRDVL